MEKKIFSSFIMFMILTVIVFITKGKFQLTVVTVEETNLSLELMENIEIETIKAESDVTISMNGIAVIQDIVNSLVVAEMNKEMSIENIGTTSKNADNVWQSINGDHVMVKDMSKEGSFELSEMGLYWGRDDIQRVFYTDVQEICEEAFEDYLSPLQGLFEILYDARKYRKRLYTDKQTAVIVHDKIMFYLFLPDNVALVSIEDRGDTYCTEVKIMSEVEVAGIRVLEISPTSGIGIAGVKHVPEEKNYAICKVITDISRMEYSKADIQLVLDCNVQWLADEVFGDYVQALQGLFLLVEQEGYGGNYAFGIEEAMLVMVRREFQTTIVEENYLEFTLSLNYQDRARVTITKNGDQYTTTFRLLKEGEFETEGQAG